MNTGADFDEKLFDLARLDDYEGIYRIVAARKAEEFRVKLDGPRSPDFWQGYSIGRGNAYQSEHENENQLVRIARHFGGDASNALDADRTIAGFVIARSTELRGAAEEALAKIDSGDVVPADLLRLRAALEKKG